MFHKKRTEGMPSFFCRAAALAVRLYVSAYLVAVCRGAFCVSVCSFPCARALVFLVPDEVVERNVVDVRKF